MPQFDITGPDGTKVRVTAPEGATQAQALSYAKSNWKDLAPSKTSATSSEKPAEQKLPAPLSWPMSSLHEGANAAWKGFQQGGPIGAVIGLTGMGAENLQKGFHKAGEAAGEAAMKYGPQIGLPPEVTAGAATLGKVGIGDALPMALGGGGGAKVGAPIVEGTAKWGMEKALGPLMAEVKNGKAATAIDTMLEKGWNVSKDGVERLKSRIEELNNEIQKKIAASKETIDKIEVAKQFRKSVDQFINRTDASKKIKEIRDAWVEFLQSPAIRGGKDIPIQQAQKTKQAISKQLGESAYDPAKRASAEVSAQKDIQKGLREEIAKKEPSVVPLNQEEHKLLQSLSIVERRAILEARKNPMGLASFSVTHPTEWMTFMADRSPAFTSWIANILNKNKQAIPGALGAAAGGAAANIQIPQPPSK